MEEMDKEIHSDEVSNSKDISMDSQDVDMDVQNLNPENTDEDR